ncbi:30S ribosomal protein S30 [Thermoproteota archaeon]
MTPKVEARERHSSAPRVDNRSSYYKRFILSRESGQYKPGQRKRRRRR